MRRNINWCSAVHHIAPVDEIAPAQVHAHLHTVRRVTLRGIGLLSAFTHLLVAEYELATNVSGNVIEVAP